jgi:hypothetical protein
LRLLLPESPASSPHWLSPMLCCVSCPKAQLQTTVPSSTGMLLILGFPNPVVPHYAANSYTPRLCSCPSGQLDTFYVLGMSTKFIKICITTCGTNGGEEERV